MTNPTDAFFGGAPTLSFSKIDPASGQHVDDQQWFGVLRGGLIVDEPVISQQTQISTGTPLTWADGRPKQQMTVTLVCDGSRALPNGNRPRDERTGGTDDGKRRLYIKSGLQRAIGDAIRAAGATGLRMGGELFIAWTGSQASKTTGHRNARTYQAVYIPPSVSVPEAMGSAGANPFGGQTPTAAPQQPAQAPSAPQAAPPQPANPFGAQAPAQAAPTAPVQVPTSAPNPFG